MSTKEEMQVFIKALKYFSIQFHPLIILIKRYKNHVKID